MFKSVSKIKLILNNCQSLNKLIFNNYFSKLNRQHLRTLNQFSDRQRQDQNKNNRNENKYYNGVKIASAIIYLSLLSTSNSNKKNLDDDTTKETPTVTTKNEDTSSNRGARFNFIADVVEIVMPGVVHIETYESTRFGSLGVSNGSGFIVSEDGFILTNAHVVRNQYNVRVKLHDGQQMIGKVIKVDPSADVAVIKIQSKNLKALKLEDSNKVRPGEFVIALGSPLTLANSVTSGIVSNISRVSSELGLRNDMQYIQTDALITFGNSGGPLINLDGKVIGMNTMMAATGISFAVPSNHMQKILDEVITNNKIKSDKTSKRYYIGMKILTIEPTILDTLKARDMIHIPDDLTTGCLIVAVAPNSPAQRAGLRSGDIITKINEKELTKSSDIFKSLDSSPHLHLTIYRNYKEIKVIVNADEL